VPPVEQACVSPLPGAWGWDLDGLLPVSAHMLDSDLLLSLWLP